MWWLIEHMYDERNPVVVGSISKDLEKSVTDLLNINRIWPV